MAAHDTPLSRRERQIMDIAYRRAAVPGQGATVAQVQADLADSPSYSAVRALLNVLVRKRHLRREHDGTRYVYYPTVSRDKARRSALRGVLSTFFDGSVESVMATLLELRSDELTVDELARLATLVQQAKQEKRRGSS